MRFDLHVHTCHSKDSLMAPDEIIRAVLGRGLDGLAITDHNSIEGALTLRGMAPFLVIVGEEIATREGEIIGLFLREAIPRGLSPEETIAAIREQQGLVYVPHPFDRIRRNALGARVLERIAQQVDALEVLNARNFLPQDNELARRFAESHGLAMGAGSDGHIPSEIGRAYVEVEPFDGPASFLAALRRGRVVGSLSSPLVHVATTCVKLRRRVSGKRLRA